MSKKSFDLNFVEKHIRKKSFGVLSTVTTKGNSHSSGVLYGVSSKDSKFYLYCLTGKNLFKTRNIQNNPNVSFVITFPHYWLRFVPASTIYFQASAEVVPFNDKGALTAFEQKRILQMMINDAQSPNVDYQPVFIRLKPKGKIHVYGLGFSLRKLRDEHTKVEYSVEIPQERK